jgi:hypothetical protein
MLVKKGSVILLAIYLLTSVPALAQSGGSYTLNWSTINGGGGVISGGQYTLIGTMGQINVGLSGGGGYDLLGGFLPGEPLCSVDFEHFARLADWWLEAACNELNYWCEGADLNHLDGVGIMDLDMFVDQWLCFCELNWPLR